MPVGIHTSLSISVDRSLNICIVSRSVGQATFFSSGAFRRAEAFLVLRHLKRPLNGSFGNRVIKPIYRRR